MPKPFYERAIDGAAESHTPRAPVIPIGGGTTAAPSGLARMFTLRCQGFAPLAIDGRPFGANCLVCPTRW